MAGKKSVKSIAKRSRALRRSRSADALCKRLSAKRREVNALIIVVPVAFLIILCLLYFLYLVYPKIYDDFFGKISEFMGSVNFSDIVFLRIISLALFILSMFLVIIILFMLIKKSKMERSASSVRGMMIKGIKKGHLFDDEEEEEEMEMNSLKPESKVLPISERKRNSATDIDLLYDLLKERKSVKLAEISKKFHISKDKALEWCKLLEEYKLARVVYHALKEPEVEVA